jgi:hypothetical protein
MVKYGISILWADCVMIKVDLVTLSPYLTLVTRDDSEPYPSLCTCRVHMFPSGRSVKRRGTGSSGGNLSDAYKVGRAPRRELETPGKQGEVLDLSLADGEHLDTNLGGGSISPPLHLHKVCKWSQGV